MSILLKKLSVILLICFANAFHLFEDTAAEDNRDVKDTDIGYRLPRNALPWHYVIKLTPNFTEGVFTYTGESAIVVDVLEKNTTNITLHVKDLDIDQKSVKLVVGNPPFPLMKPKLWIDPEKDFLILTFNKFLPLGKHRLTIKYTGKLRDDFKGFYRSSYVNEDGVKTWIGASQFKPTHARLAYPCWDEPDIKARYTISISHHHEYKAISSMPFMMITPDRQNIGNSWTNFRQTPKMSTYQIGFVVFNNDFKSIDDGKFRIFARPHAIRNIGYAQHTSQKVFAALNEYTGNPLNDVIPQITNFAMPQVISETTQNWGLITYRESDLLYEDNITTAANKQETVSIISRQFAHLWFGTLVSPLNWDYTWLNEGFANYFQYCIADKVEDTWRMMDQFVVKNLQEVAFTADDKEDQHPMNVKVSTPSEISEMFDSVSSSKASSVIRMISHALTEEVFQSGLQAYIQNMSYRAANTDDLFKQFINATTTVSIDVDVKEFLDLWVTQPGYPIVMVNRDYTMGSAEISQHRFLTTRSKESTEKWIIPINYATQQDPSFSDTKPSNWVDGKIIITGIANGWMIFNKQQTGYYRVNYDLENWKRITKHLTSAMYEEIHVLNRAQLLDDSFHLAQAGELKDYSVFLDITVYLKQETDYIPWYTVFRAFEALDKSLANTETRVLFKLYILDLIEKLEKTIGYTEQDTDEHVTKFNRNNVIDWACRMGSKNCLDATHKQLVEHVLGSTKIPMDSRKVVLCSGMRAANATIWQRAFEFYEKSDIQVDRNSIFTALGCSADKMTLQSFLTKSLDAKSEITPYNALKSVLAGSTTGVDVAFDFIRDHVAEIVAIDNGDTASVLDILYEIADRMTTAAQLDKLNNFIATNTEIATELKEKAVTSVRKNIEWLKKNEAHIGSFLKAQQPIIQDTNGNNSQDIILPFLPAIFVALTVITIWHH